ncbi:CDP-glycerol glycerophosphotransferase family protein [Paenibacillus sp. J5C_2022]|uniref:glycosyltransferase n=1 Tax=Paenibacillus sp. J5C2022 TaxID=2977129 RepID=UPI0021D0577D|nr:glycosyltransferase [Paenibacillus sp. J5C2022]MCU6709196.1 CDP-glycerol glycerophosphotransferase family protein [Paenibacillus sp. J5C2022]
MLTLEKINKGMRMLVAPMKSYFQSNSFRTRIKYTKYFNENQINSNTILYESYHGKNMSCNPYAIFLEILKNPKYNDYKHIWALNDNLDVYLNKYKSYSNIEFVRINSKEYLKYLTSAKYLINNVTFPTYFQKKEGQVYINTWHGTPIKTLGKYINNTLVDHANVTRNLLQADMIINPNKFTADIIVDSYDLDGIYSGEISDQGYPRIDLTINPIENVRESLSIGEEGKIILYAPTWRGIGNKPEKAIKETYDQIIKLTALIPTDYQLIVKIHNLAYKEIIKLDIDRFKLIPDTIDTNELLSIVDVLITDYSSIFVDYMVTKKPIIFYMFDRYKYLDKRGLIIDIETLPGPVYETIEQLMRGLERINEVHELSKEKYENMLKVFNYNDDGFASSRLISNMFEKKATIASSYSILDEKKINILFYCGGLVNNGITSSVINLLNAIDYNKYNVAILEKYKYDEVSRNNLLKINRKVKRLHRVGSMNHSLFEVYKNLLITKLGINSKWLSKIYPTELYTREINRILGNSRFDVAVDFSGYTPFWTSLISSGNFKRKVIYQHNDMAEEYRKKISGVYKHKRNLDIIFPLYSNFDKIVAVSKHTMEKNLNGLEQYIDRDKITYVHNCLDYNKIQEQLLTKEIICANDNDYLLIKKIEGDFLELKGIKVPNREKIHFVTMGRLSPEKDHLKLIDAFEYLSKENENVMLHIIGQGPMEKELKRKVAKLRLKERVVFTGQLTNPFSYIDACDCFVLSSNHEGQPMVLLEALTMRKPIISTDIAGSRSVLEGGYGLLVENNVKGLVYGMQKYIHQEYSSLDFNYKEYNVRALRMFYREVCNV